jgi:N-acetylglucosaminyldiphosphoundecaprenol N-acetyl-beta-D-mannosaminyltransferase
MSSHVHDRSATEPMGSDLRINLMNMGTTLDTIISRATAGRGFTLFTINLDHMVKLNKSRQFREAYSRADYITADGWPILWLARGADRRRSPRPGSVDRRQSRQSKGLERTTGADLLEPMCREAAKHGLPLYFVGPGAASQTAGIEILKGRYPQMQVVGAESPQLLSTMDDATIMSMAERISMSGARICVLSLGAPKQEVLADVLSRKCPEVGFLCVGAALDFISGHAIRAPKWVQKARMEWFWRMASNPRRLVGRYASCAITLFKLSCPSLFRNNPRLLVVDGE